MKVLRIVAPKETNIITAMLNWDGLYRTHDCEVSQFIVVIGLVLLRFEVDIIMSIEEKPKVNSSIHL